MPIDTLITIGVFTAVALLFIFAGVKTVPQGNNWTVERFGRYTQTLKPGLNLIIPFIDKIGQRISMMERVLDIPAIYVLSIHNANLVISHVSVVLRIISPKPP